MSFFSCSTVVLFQICVRVMFFLFLFFFCCVSFHLKCCIFWLCVSVAMENDVAVVARQHVSFSHPSHPNRTDFIIITTDISIHATVFQTHIKVKVWARERGVKRKKHAQTHTILVNVYANMRKCKRLFFSRWFCRSFRIHLAIIMALSAFFDLFYKLRGGKKAPQNWTQSCYRHRYRIILCVWIWLCQHGQWDADAQICFYFRHLLNACVYFHRSISRTLFWHWRFSACVRCFRSAQHNK